MLQKGSMIQTRSISRKLVMYFFLLIFLIFIFFQSIWAEFLSEDSSQGAEPDTLRAAQKKFKNKSTSEQIVSFPLQLIYFPVDLVFDGIADFLGILDDSKIVLKTYDLLYSDDGKRSVLATYGSDKGAGLRYTRKGYFTPNSKLSLSATAGLRNRQRYKLQFQRLQPWGNSLTMDLLAQYYFRPDEWFFGIGPDSRYEDKSNYAHEQARIEFDIGNDLSETFQARAVVGFEVNSIMEGRNKRFDSTTDKYTPETLPGMEKKIQLIGYGLMVRYDSQNRLGSPSVGGIMLLKGEYFQDVGEHQYGFWKATLDLSRHLHLFHNRVLSLRVAGEAVEPLSGNEVPFFYLSEIGRQETVRGFKRGRFMAYDMVLLSAEYRYPIWRRLEAFLFIEGGQVSHDIFQEFSLDQFKKGYGGGIRLWSQAGVVTSLELGKSRDGYRLYLGLNKEL